MFAQLRHRERKAGRDRSLYFWRDRTREVDFVVETAKGLELLEAKWTELPSAGDATNLEFVRRVTERPKITSGAIVCRAPHGFPLGKGLRALPVTDLG